MIRCSMGTRISCKHVRGTTVVTKHYCQYYIVYSMRRAGGSFYAVFCLFRRNVNGHCSVLKGQETYTHNPGHTKSTFTTY